MARYTIGIDFGTLSGRAVLVDVADGREVASAVYEYANGAMDEQLPDGTPLGPDWALQDPADYLRTLEVTIPQVLAEAARARRQCHRHRHRLHRLHHVAHQRRRHAALFPRRVEQSSRMPG